jgi:PhzF family phenazine biosynthesis protein
MNMAIKFFQVDAFARAPFEGNPAAVCLLPEARPAAWMQRVAQEMNLSETAFLVPRPHGFGLRWFTPATEVDLCGHATLASAHALWESGAVAEAAEIRFHTASGLLTAERCGGLIELDFPARPAAAVSAPAGLAEALGATPLFVALGVDDYLVLLDGPAAVRNLKPDFPALAATGARGVIVTAPSDVAGADFVSRFFGPAVGIDEDPVTGSAHCTLAPFWAQRLGKEAMVGYQASARGGWVSVRMAGERVRLGGTAVTVLRGELTA